MTPLRVLLLEDSPSDAKLVTRVLRQSGREVVAERVDDGATLRRMLIERTWDVVLSDWSMPSFNTLDALAIINELELDVPFIIVSGTIGEERAVAAMRAGAHDYVLKDNLARLVPAVEREVREAEERKRRRVAEQELGRHEARFQALIERMRELVTIIGADGEVRYASPAATAVLGRSPASLIGRPLFVHVHPDDAPAVASLMTELLSGAEPNGGVELRMRLPDGSDRWIQADGIDLRAKPAIGGLVVHLRDVHERRQAIDALHAAETRYRRIVETTNEGVWTIDPQGVTTFVNRRMAELLGRAPEVILGRSALDFLDEASRAVVERNLRQRLPAMAGEGEIGLFRPDGSEVRARVEVSPIRDELGHVAGMLGMVRDVSEQRRAEEARRRAEEALARVDEQLRHAQKMEAIGRLAGGVAHDFNNLLSVILSYASMALDELPADHPMATDLREIRGAGERAASLTRQLLAFSRQQVLEPQVVELDAVVTDMERMCRRILGEDVQLTVKLAADSGKILVDPGAFEQVIMNLVVNARDAMPRGGRLTLETTNVTIDEAFAAAHLDVKPGPHVQLAVTDTGHGMDAAIVQRIFEPFFTTKERGRGTGLGLSTVFGIVRQAGGTIWVYSEVGVGTTFRVLIPRRDAPLTATRRDEPIDRLGGTETVLLVEDDDEVRAVTRGILTRHGYTVLDARSPGEALAIAGTHDFDLLLTDIVMPEMSGPALAHRLRERRPDLKVLCMSGYTDEAVVQHGLMDAGLSFLNKPLVPDALLRKVRATLAR